MTASWHLISYDIRSHKNGRKVHRQVRKSGIFVLESLYLCSATQTQHAELMSDLRKLAGPSANDVLSYQLLPGAELMIFGTGIMPDWFHCYGLPRMRAIPHD